MLYAEILGISDIIGLAIVAGVILYALRFSHRKLEVKLGSLHATVDHVNGAVNNRPAGEPSIYEHARGTREVAEGVAAKLDEFMQYQRDRNHDILNDVTAARGLARMAVDQLEVVDESIAGIKTDLETVTTDVVTHLAAHQAEADRCSVQSAEACAGCTSDDGEAA